MDAGEHLQADLLALALMALHDGRLTEASELTAVLDNDGAVLVLMREVLLP